MPEDAAVSYTIAHVESPLGIVLQIRATISTRSELEELIAKLNRRLNTDFAQEEKTSEQPDARPVRSDAPTVPHIFDSAGR